MSMIRKTPAMLIAAAMAAAAGTGQVLSPRNDEPSTLEKDLRSLRFIDLSPGMSLGRFNYHRGPGWTHAQVKRMARKARNLRRHKLACRAKSKKARA